MFCSLFADGEPKSFGSLSHSRKPRRFSFRLFNLCAQRSFVREKFMAATASECENFLFWLFKRHMENQCGVCFTSLDFCGKKHHCNLIDAASINSHSCRWWRFLWTWFVFFLFFNFFYWMYCRCAKLTSSRRKRTQAHRFLFLKRLLLVFNLPYT